MHSVTLLITYRQNNTVLIRYLLTKRILDSRFSFSPHVFTQEENLKSVYSEYLFDGKMKVKRLPDMRFIHCKVILTVLTQEPAWPRFKLQKET